MAAQGHDQFSSYGIDEGLPQSSVWSIAEDKNGFLWASTSDGICRFDGYSFTVYKNDPNDPHSLVNGFYYRFYVDSSGALWVISQNGISLYNDIKDNFSTITTYRQQYPTDNFNCIFGEDETFLWVGITNHGRLKIDKRSHKVFPIERNGVEERSQIKAWQSGFVSKGKIWRCTGNAECYIYDIKTGILHKPPTPDIFAIADLNENEVIAATLNGLIIFNKNDLSFKTIALAVPDWRKDRVKTIFVQPGSEVLLGCGQGLIRINSATWKITKVTRSFTLGQKNSYSNVQCIYKDRSDNIWIGTNGDGLKKLTAPNKKFKIYTSFNDSSNLVKAVYADRKFVYAGYFGNGLDMFDREDGFVKNVALKTPSATLRHIYAVTAADSNTLLLNMADVNAIYSYSISTGALTSLLPLIARILPDYTNVSNDYPFFFRTGNTIYTGLHDYLISIDISRSGKVVAKLADRFPDEVLTCVFKDNAGTIWLGTINGAFYLDGKEHRKIQLPEIVRVKSINQDTKGNLWIGTINGIYTVDTNKKVIQHYTEANGLSNRFIYGILRDDDGNMWFSHNKGLSVYKNNRGTFRHYTKEDGLQSNEFNTGAYFKADDGTLFFGGINGTNGFDPREIVDNPHIPQVRITGIRLFDKPMKTDVAYWNITDIRLPYTQNSLSFEFTGLEFTNPKQNKYAYMMKGIDKNWIFCDDNRFARYPGLPAGEYTFKVKASNNDGAWQNKPAVISISIVPPFWQHLWFRILILVLLIGGIAGIILWFQKQRYKRKMRAIELQQKIQMERERISRDLHDTVGTQLSLISNNIEWVQHPLKEISEDERSDKLNYVNQMARDIIATLRETIWALNKEQISLEEFSDKLKTFAQKQLTIYPEIELKFLDQIAEPIVLGPSEALNLFRICQEAIANALKYSGAVLITIDIGSTAAKYTISIIDNGKGFDIDSVDPAVQNGLENMRYRADDINSILEISTAANKGTKVTIAKE